MKLWRNRIEWLIAILQATSKVEGLKVTHVQSVANLSSADLYPALKFLVEKDLLEKFYQKRKAKFPLYRTTEEGKRIVRLYREVEKALAMEVSGV